PAEHVTERGNPKNAKGVREVVAGLTAEWMNGGLRLVDTPGVVSAHGRSSDVNHRHLPMVNSVIFPMSAHQRLSRNEDAK
ncbi:MAG: hypothetical protein ACTS5I_01835, partial [Rhodanobacter sp.]